MRFSNVFLFASFAVSGFATTVDNVKADIATIASQLTSLDNAITAFLASGGSLLQGLPVHTSAVALINSLAKTTTDVTAVQLGSISETDGLSILASLEALVPTIMKDLDGVVSMKAGLKSLPVVPALPLFAFSNLPIIGAVPVNLAKQDLVGLSAGVDAFAQVLIAAAPKSLTSQGSALRDRVHAAFASAIAQYGL